MDEGRKRVLLIAAAILASRKLSSESVTPGQSPRVVAVIRSATTLHYESSDVCTFAFGENAGDTD
jgi:hypothetical protein